MVLFGNPYKQKRRIDTALRDHTPSENRPICRFARSPGLVVFTGIIVTIINIVIIITITIAVTVAIIIATLTE